MQLLILILKYKKHLRTSWISYFHWVRVRVICQTYFVSYAAWWWCIKLFKPFPYSPHDQNCTWLNNSITVRRERLPYLQRWLQPGAAEWRPMGSSMLQWSAPPRGALAGCKPHLIWWGGSSLPVVELPTPTASRLPAWSHSQCWWAQGGGCHTGSVAEHMKKNCDYDSWEQESIACFPESDIPMFEQTQLLCFQSELYICAVIFIELNLYCSDIVRITVISTAQ